MMLDDSVAAASPSSVYRVLREEGLLKRWNHASSKKGTGFVQPTKPHEHWHIDVCYLNIKGTFYYLCSILDGYSRFIVHWELKEAMKERDVELVVQKAHELYPDEKPRIISDNGPQFVSHDFKRYVRFMGMDHVRTSPYYPQSNGKKERYFKTLKSECIRVKTPLCLEDGRQVVKEFVKEYNEVRLHSAIGYVTPLAKLSGQEERIFEDRKEKLEKARLNRKQLSSERRELQPIMAKGMS